MSAPKKQATLGRFFTALKRPQDGATAAATVKKSKVEAAECLAAPAGHEQDAEVKNSLPELADKPAPGGVLPQAASAVPRAQSSPVKPAASTSVMYADLCAVFEAVEATSSRLSITKLCADFMYSVLKCDPGHLIPVTYLFINRLGPDYEPGLELGLGEGILIKTISDACGKSAAQVRSSYRECGDLGTVAQQARVVQPTMFKPKPLTVRDVFSTLQAIAQAEGKDSQGKKIRLIKKMLTACQGMEAKYLIRSLESKLRIGLAEKTVLVALSKAILTHEHDGKEPSPEQVDAAEALVRDTFCQVPNYEMIINAALQYGIMNLPQHCVLTPGIPLKPMLAKPTKSITEVLDRFQGQRFTCEYKYDGERAQVHLMEDGTIRIYSRNSENMTERYPEIQFHQFLANPQTTRSLIIDCEAVAWDNEKQKILPFQVLSTRKRKGVELKDVKVRVCLFAFDLLYLNGESLLKCSLADRRKHLYSVLKVVPGELQFANEITTMELSELQTYLEQSVSASCEGLMVKMLDGEESQYEPSKRSRNWLKLKKDYLEGVGDSLDLAVLGAYYGRGKRTGTYGGFLLGCYNPDLEEFETCCKIGTGFSEEVLQSLHAQLKDTVIAAPRGDVSYDDSSPPDVWFEPAMLFEVLTADLSLSPVYKAGRDVYGKGISLRFPRFLRIREDKSVTDATSSDQIVEFYQRQANSSG
ncbi:ACL155Wp [Eremothecium gossypii ATCC 10895]|uniref:DNA ligase n=1 Tax=Eremothecium gossypii (strain ATCC 10895 / CBS 109.51 / FGSC 9923 / NRRL Y-1056) TaxID=284811 RepID=Q75CS4_EREGS|nr:ACL155Wp [Eremothecium gossypii ATCC 10895]AAS51073.1 ACL155Wp [Eremothecium gossypii ATCC 10895]AEY95363.1 FACL155Wp [Eremothecium gossypii FDAG1]